MGPVGGFLPLLPNRRFDVIAPLHHVEEQLDDRELHPVAHQQDRREADRDGGFLDGEEFGVQLEDGDDAGEQHADDAHDGADIDRP